ncbi:hypothetical protein E2I00_014780, partial [Balaenoptera physalus]
EVIQNSKEVLSLLQGKNPAFKPVLAIIQAGDDNLMQEVNQNLAEEAGLNITHICLPADSGEDEIIDEILKINEDTRVHGLALQISETSFSDKILNALKPEKDVDGVTDVNLGKLVRGDAHECFVSPVARAVIELLEKDFETALSSGHSCLPCCPQSGLQTGMRGAFGKPQGTVAWVHVGQIVMSIRTKLQNKEHAKFKFPGRQKIHISKKWGFTKFNADEYENMVVEKWLIPDSCGIKYIPNRVNLDGKKVLVIGAHGSLEATLQCLFQRRGSMTMSSQWKTPQLQS